RRRWAAASAAARPACPWRHKPPTRRFSSTVSSVITAWPSGTCATPARTISSGGRRVRSVPSSATRPFRARTSPLMVASRVVLPAPFAPSTAVIVPGRAVIDTSWSAITPPYPASTCSTARAAWLAMWPPCPRLVRAWPLRARLVRAWPLCAWLFRAWFFRAWFLHAQVGGGHRRVGLHLLRRAEGDQLAEVEDGDAVAHRHHQVHAVLHHHDAGVRGEL